MNLGLVVLIEKLINEYKEKVPILEVLGLFLKT